MPALILSSFDRLGGAAIAANRLHKALQEVSYPSRMIVGRKLSAASAAAPRFGVWGSRWFRMAVALERRIQRGFGIDSQGFQPGWPVPPGSVPFRRPGEVVHAHWIADGFVTLNSLARMREPLVITLHDMWHFTGGCHYDNGCGRYVDGCRGCPLLPAERSNLAENGWVRRRNLADRKQPVVTSPSRWLADLARSSGTFSGLDIRVIPNPLDLRIFRPRDREAARSRLEIPQEKKVVAFSALSTRDPRKGWKHLRAALGLLGERHGDLLALVMGHSVPEGWESLPMEVRWTGSLADEETIATYLAAADVFVAPSEQENYPNTIAEALACGIPCVGFRIGGIPEMIQDGRTGGLAEPFDPAALGQAIDHCLVNAQEMGKACREFAESTFGESVVSQFVRLYDDLARKN